MDERGYCQIAGRLKEMIIRGGENIYPREIEQVLFGHPAVADVVVAGRPSERWGQEVAAIVQLVDGASATPDELLAEAGTHVARYKLPKVFLFLPVIVRSPSGKADYRWAKERALEA